MPTPATSKGQNSKALQPETWIQSHGDHLYSYCVLRVENSHVAEDLIQETFLSAWKAKDTFRGGSSERTWLISILKNKIIDHYRQRQPRAESLSGTEEAETMLYGKFFAPSDGHWLREAAPGSWPESADTGITRSEFAGVLQKCIARMPAALVPVFVAKYLDDEDSETICKVHGISSSNYWVIIHRAKLLIRACLEKNWFLKE
ncbi:MAG TPA: sigma-70 family RNA polymerase sigma factor [Cyclobacteriaceae bacterium]|nr:sigma-70 family RNA polymerase sigma factor [Cyclobacteriaceae bacterium]